MSREFISFQADDRLEDILKSFAKNHQTAAPVFDGKEFIGIVSDISIVRYFTPGQSNLPWKKGKPVGMDKDSIKKVTAADLVKKPNVTLRADEELASVLNRMAAKADCIPVFEKDKVIGVVRGDYIVSFLLRKFAFGELKEIASTRGGLEQMGTEIDKILEIVRSEKEIYCSDIAKRLGISVKSTETLCEVLQKNHLVEMRYTFLKGAVVKSVDRYEKG
jgi:predicted transcriptional regulator